MIAFWNERLPGRVAGGREIVAVYADHDYLGALACDAPVADAVGIVLHLAERLRALHRPCHEPERPDAPRQCLHVSDLLDPPWCLECTSDGGRRVEWPCPTLRLTMPGVTSWATPAWGLTMGRVGRGKTDGGLMAAVEEMARRYSVSPISTEEAQGWTHWVPGDGGPAFGITACGYELRRDDGVSYTTDPDRLRNSEVDCPRCLTGVDNRQPYPGHGLTLTDAEARDLAAAIERGDTD